MCSIPNNSIFVVTFDDFRPVDFSPSFFILINERHRLADRGGGGETKRLCHGVPPPVGQPKPAFLRQQFLEQRRHSLRVRPNMRQDWQARRGARAVCKSKKSTGPRPTVALECPSLLGKILSFFCLVPSRFISFVLVALFVASVHTFSVCTTASCRSSCIVSHDIASTVLTYMTLLEQQY